MFASYPDGVIAIRVEVKQPGTLNFKAGLSTPHNKSPEVERLDESTLRLTGAVDDFEDSRGRSFFEAQ